MTFAFLTSSPVFYQTFSDFVARIEAQFGRTGVIAQIHSDSATYYEKNQALQEICRKKGIQQLFSPPYTQELNGIAERTIRTVLEMTRAMMLQAGVPKSLFGEAMQYAVYIINRLPYRSKTGAFQTRLMRWTGRSLAKSSYKAVRVFGCAAWVHLRHNTGPAGDKLEAKAKEYVFLGIDEDHQCYRLGAPPYYKLVRSAHVIFHEDEFPCKRQPGHPSSEQEKVALLSTNVSDIAAVDALNPQPTTSGRPQRSWAPSCFKISQTKKWPPSPTPMLSSQKLMATPPPTPRP